MKCPFCHEEMELGYIQSSHKIMWGKDKHADFFVPNKENAEFYISDGFWSGSFAKAEYCNKCKKIILSLENE